MSYDLYVDFTISSKGDLDDVVNGNYNGFKIPDIATRIRLLTGIDAQEAAPKEYVVAGDRKVGGGYKSLVHAKMHEESCYTKELINEEYNSLDSLNLLKPDVPNLMYLPLGSWFLQFNFTLAKPWISKDDDPFYVTDSVNPVRKDKVFKVPMMAASSWKGLLRWTAMHTRLACKKDALNDNDFAEERFAQTLLFGDEKGDEPGEKKEFAGYLDNEIKQRSPKARMHYERCLRKYFHLSTDDPMPHHRGRLMFYPTYFNSIDVEVINPHSRETKAGTHPIYLECVPKGAEGTFSLLYIPFDLIGRDGHSKDEIKNQASKDLRRVAESIQAMMLTYGFSAKRTSGYGTAKDEIKKVKFLTRSGGNPMRAKSLTELALEVTHVEL